MKLVPGMVISCKIFDKKVDRGTLSLYGPDVLKVEWEDGPNEPWRTWYFNIVKPWVDGVTDIKILDRKLADGLEVGDVVECSSRSAEATVLAVVGGGVLLSAWDDFDIAGPWYTLGELVRKGVELKKEPTRAEDKPTELTIDQIAEKFGLKPEQVRIKKETE